eukprot:1028135-Rhodomonas_salina.5
MSHFALSDPDVIPASHPSSPGSIAAYDVCRAQRGNSTPFRNLRPTLRICHTCPPHSLGELSIQNSSLSMASEMDTIAETAWPEARHTHLPPSTPSPVSRPESEVGRRCLWLREHFCQHLIPAPRILAIKRFVELAVADLHLVQAES